MPKLVNEKELEDYLYKQYKDDGVPVFRQVNIEGCGTIDLLTIDVSPGDASWKDTYYDICIIELKQDTVGYSELGQLMRYMTTVKRMLGRHPKSGNISITGKLIGSDIIINSDFVFLLDAMAEYGVFIETYKIDIKTGITFEDVGMSWFCSKEDTTKAYEFISKEIANCTPTPSCFNPVEEKVG